MPKEIRITPTFPHFQKYLSCLCMSKSHFDADQWKHGETLQINRRINYSIAICVTLPRTLAIIKETPKGLPQLK